MDGNNDVEVSAPKTLEREKKSPITENQN